MPLPRKDKILFVSISILVIYNLVGFIGIHSIFQNLFLSLTPLSLLLSTVLLFLNNQQLNKRFILFCFIVFVSGFLIEVTGVKSGVVFGNYSYGATLGVKLFNVPLIIGINWLMLVYMAGCIFSELKTNIVIKSLLGATSLVLLDLFIEPVAIKYDFWTWKNGTIPLQNYCAWFVVSFLLLLVFYKSNFSKSNRFAIILFSMQLVFFYFIQDNSMLQTSHFTYSILLLATIAYPILQSFENRIMFYKTWKYLFPAIICTASIFIAGDIWFVNSSIWKFNPEYVLGFYFFNLPFEEWLFFIVIPFACVFVYQVMNHFVKKDVFSPFAKYITLVLSFTLIIISLIFHNQTYTLTTFLTLGLFLLFHQFVLKSTYLGRFYLSWLVCLIPFFMVNGVLTAMPVLIYNPAHMLGIRLYTIPLEDTFYGMLNILLVITLYEEFRKRALSY